MANANAPFGFRLIGSLAGSNSAIQMMKCYAAAGDSTNIYQGDAVVNAGGADTVNNTYLPTITASTTSSDVCLGIAQSIDQVDKVADSSMILSRNYRPASTALYIWVCIDPLAKYIAQGSGATTTDMMGNCSIIYTTAGNTTTGVSGMQINNGGMTTTNTLQVRVLQAHRRADSDPTLSNAIYEVMLNSSSFKVGVAGV